MASEDGPKYDVAISLLSEDASTGEQLADRLQRAGWDVFFYRRRREETAGPEGVESFRTPFREDTRFSVILFRDGWGETDWTAVEAQAIKERQLEDHWRSFQVVRVGPGELPKWIPDDHIYVDFDEFGVEGAAAVIDDHLRQSGAEASPETPTERAARLERQAERRRAGKQFLDSADGKEAVRSAVNELFSYLSSEAEAMSDDDVPISFERHPRRGGVAAVSLPNAAFVLGFTGVVPASSSTLYVQEFAGRYRLAGVMFEEPDKVDEVQGRFRADADGNVFMYDKADPDRLFSPKEFGEHFLQRALDRNYKDR